MASGGGSGIIAHRDADPKTMDYEHLPKAQKDSCERLMSITRGLKVSWGDMEGCYYKQHRAEIFTAVAIYDNLRKPGMPLYSMKKSHLFVSSKNPHAIIRVSDRTWGRFEKIAHCKEVWTMLEEGGLTSDILDKCVSGHFNTKKHKMVFTFKPPSEASKYVDPHAEVEIANMFEAYNKEVRGVEQKAQEVRRSVGGMTVEDIQKEAESSYSKVVVKKEEEEDVEEEEEEEDVDELKKRVNDLEGCLIRMWNEMGSEDLGVWRDLIADYIPDKIDEGDDDEIDLESVSDVSEILTKKVYMCGKCKENGVNVPKKGHSCPYRET